MRVLMWFTIGFTIACAIGVYLVSGVFLGLLALLTLAAAIPLFILKSRLCKITAAVLFGFAIGAGWLWGFESIYLQPARQYDTQTVSGTVTVSDYSYDTKYGIAADAHLSLEGRDYKARVYVTGGEQLSPGDTITGKFRLRLTTEGSEEGATYHQGKGIFFLAYADKEAVVSRAEQVPPVFFAAKLRRQITLLLDAAFPEDTLAFARALLLGDSSKLSYEEDTSFKISGIRHVIAVSGLHISILFSLILTISGRRGLSTTLIGIPVLLLFAAVAGFTPSVVRACIMQALVILALLFKREYDPPTALSFAVLVMLAVNPLTITSVSFQLSVGCLIGIFLFYQKMYDFFCRLVPRAKEKGRFSQLLRWLLGSVSITLSAMSITTPMSAAYFGTVSIVGVLTNLLTLWVVSFIFYGIILVCVLGLFWTAGAKVVAWVVSWPIRYILWIAEGLSGFSLSAVYTSSIYIVVWLVLCYVLLAVFFLGRRKHPAVLTACMCFGLIVAITASWLETRLNNYRFTVLDVGQGQCILWQCDGRCFLVDCGGDTPASAADIAASYLLAHGIDRLDGVILTHYDEDHAGGILLLMSRIDVDVLYLPDVQDDNGFRAAFENDHADSIFWVNKNTYFGTDEMTISLYPSSSEKQGNESGLCVLFQAENCDILITGDRDISGERELLESVELPDLEILVAGHHGSKYSTGLELLHAGRPDDVVISVSADNSYGHPSDEVLKRLKMFGCTVWRTDLDQTITFKG